MGGSRLLEKTINKYLMAIYDLTGKIDVVGNEINKIDIKIEHKIEPKIQALFEAKDIIYEKLDNLEVKVDNLSSRR